MTVFSSNFSGRSTKPESRCGRSPMVVRMTRSQEIRGSARLAIGRAEAAVVWLTGAGGGGAAATGGFRAAHPAVMPVAAKPAAVCRNSRLRILVLDSRPPAVGEPDVGQGPGHRRSRMLAGMESQVNRE